MGMSCGMLCAKYLVYFLNALFAVTGLVLVTVGAVILARYYHYSTFIGETFWSAPLVLIIVGAVVFFIAFVGCCGAAKESSWMTLTFSILLILIFLTEVGVGIAGYVKHSELRDSIDDQFNKTMRNYNTSADARRSWKMIQTELNCCGIVKAEDWHTVFGRNNNTLTPSCCNKLDQNGQCTYDLVEKTGCKEKLVNFLDDNALLLGAVGLGIAGIQLLGVCLGCCLSRGFKENYEAV